VKKKGRENKVGEGQWLISRVDREKRVSYTGIREEAIPDRRHCRSRDTRIGLCLASSGHMKDRRSGTFIHKRNIHTHSTHVFKYF